MARSVYCSCCGRILESRMIHRTDPPAGGERPTLARTLPLWFCTTCDYTGEADGPDLSKFTG